MLEAEFLVPCILERLCLPFKYQHFSTAFGLAHKGFPQQLQAELRAPYSYR